MLSIPRFDETDFTTALAGALDRYVEAQGTAPVPDASTPHPTYQSTVKLDTSRPFDLIKQLTESAVLVLEVKVSSDGVELSSFNARQREIDAALRDAGVPLDYCYNLAEDYRERRSPTYTLEHSVCAPPDDVCDERGAITPTKAHEPLRAVVDRMLASGRNGGALGALFARGVLTRLRQVNAKCLFFAVHAEREHVLVLDLEQVVALYAAVEREVQLQAIDLETASRDELIRHFNYAAHQVRSLVRWHARVAGDPPTRRVRAAPVEGAGADHDTTVVSNPGLLPQADTGTQRAKPKGPTM